MSLYPRADERAIRLQRELADWTASGLLTAEQRGRIEPELRVDLRRTNRFLRITLFVFGFLIVNALTGLVAVGVGFDEDAAMVVSLLASGGCLALAQMMVTRYRFYHFGVEEAAAVAAVSFFAVAAGLVMTNTFSVFQALTAAAIGSFIIFMRFGYVYAAIAATLFAAMVPFGLELSDTAERLIGMVIMLTAYFFARERRQDHDWDYPGDAYAAIEAVAWASLYLLVNLKASSWLSSPDELPQFYWATYAGIWMLPVAGLWIAVRDRHRLSLDVNIVMAIVTLMSNKPYLGGAQNPWDPIVFGVVLVVVAIGIRRWLASGADGSRRGYVAERLLASERERLAAAGTVSVLAPGAPAPHTHEPPALGGGGQSGGAGASGKF